MSTYAPAPIKTRKIRLSSPLRRLVNQLARNAHEVWAAQRLADGWKYGPRRDDAGKKHPCLVPYEELPGSEKVYDRIMVTQTLKATLALGYFIRRKE